MAVAVITGSSTGIGFETALALSRAGLSTYATMRTPERSPELGAIAQQEGLLLRVIPLDVTDDSSVAGAFTRILTHEGRIDVLVNNAGISLIGPVEELNLDAFRQSMETNYFGSLRCIKAVLPGMREKRSGCIINVSSVAGRVASAAQSPYVASKFALEGLSEVLAQEVKGFNIRVALVEPGFISTPMLDKLRPIPADTHYPHERRSRATMAASLSNPVPPSIVAEKIREIVTGDTWQLRHPVGPDARSMLAWRRMMSDEEWIDRSSELDNEAWCERMQQEFGINLRPYLEKL